MKPSLKAQGLSYPLQKFLNATGILNGLVHTYWTLFSTSWINVDVEMEQYKHSSYPISHKQVDTTTVGSLQ